MDADAQYGYEMELEYADFTPLFDFDTVDYYREFMDAVPEEGAYTGFEEWSE
jgi:hypothetical protein